MTIQTPANSYLQTVLPPLLEKLKKDEKCAHRDILINNTTLYSV